MWCNMFLENILLLSLYGSLSALMIGMVKKFLVGCLSVKWHYYIWFILLLRLAIPCLPQTHISLYNMLIPVQHYMTTIDITTEASDGETILSTKDSFKIPKSSDGMEALNDLTPMPLKTDLTSEKFPFIFGDIHILFIIWLIGFSLLLTISITSNIHYMIKVEKGSIKPDCLLLKTLEESKKILKLKKHVILLKSRHVKTPALHGIFKPKILIPGHILDSLTPEELRHIILHELIHVKRNDILINYCILFIQFIYWFNPIIWFSLNSMKKDSEMMCDANVLSYLPNAEINKYGMTIIKLLSFLNTHQRPSELSVGFLGRILLRKFSTIERRINMVQRFSQNKKNIPIIAVMLLFVMSLSLLTNAKSELIVDEKNKVTTNNVESSLSTDDHTEPSLNTSMLQEDMLTNQVEINNVTPNAPVNTISEFPDFIMPIAKDKYQLVAHYGNRIHPITNEKKFHTGIDLAAEKHTDIQASLDGIVVYSGWQDYKTGNMVVIQHKNNYSSYYLHCSKLYVYEGDLVDQGDIIASVGATGLAQSLHLHFEIRESDTNETVNPLDLIR